MKYTVYSMDNKNSSFVEAAGVCIENGTLFLENKEGDCVAAFAPGTWSKILMERG